jgi:hypothetical protein
MCGCVCERERIYEYTHIKKEVSLPHPVYICVCVLRQCGKSFYPSVTGMPHIFQLHHTIQLLCNV